MPSSHEYELKQAADERRELQREQAAIYIGHNNALDNAWTDYCQAEGLDACSVNYIQRKVGFYAGYVMGRHERLQLNHEIPAGTRTSDVEHETAEAGSVEDVSKATSS